MYPQMDQTEAAVQGKAEGFAWLILGCFHEDGSVILPPFHGDLGNPGKVEEIPQEGLVLIVSFSLYSSVE